MTTEKMHHIRAPGTIFNNQSCGLFHILFLSPALFDFKCGADLMVFVCPSFFLVVVFCVVCYSCTSFTYFIYLISFSCFTPLWIFLSLSRLSYAKFVFCVVSNGLYPFGTSNFPYVCMGYRIPATSKVAMMILIQYRNSAGAQMNAFK